MEDAARQMSKARAVLLAACALALPAAVPLSAQDAVIVPAPAAAPQPASVSEAKAEQKQKNLEEINRHLEEKRRELDQYRAEEERITAELAGLKKEEKQTTSRRQELEGQLERARQRTADSRQRYDSLERSRKNIETDLPGQLLMFSLQKDFFFPYYGLRDLGKDLLMRESIRGKLAIRNTLRGETQKVNRDLAELNTRSLDLRARQDLLKKQASAHKNVLRTKQEELERTRGLQARLSAEVEALQNASLGLTRLVKKLQKQAPYRVASDTGALPIMAKSLPWPADGKIISRFGREEVPALKTYIVREGVRIAAPHGAPVRAVLAGKVIYSGPFRTYGNVVIVDHEKGFFTIYGLLSRIDAAKGQAVEALTQLGAAGEDTQAVGAEAKPGEGAVYFEIRKGDRALNPMQWLAN